jgi:hypothetical protein
MATTYSTRQAAKLLETTIPVLNTRIYYGHLEPPQKNSRGRYRWTQIDIDKAREMLKGQSNAS